MPSLTGIIEGLGGEAPFVEKGRQQRRQERREDIQDKLQQEEFGLRKRQVGIQEQGIQERLAELQRRLAKDTEWKPVGSAKQMKDGSWAQLYFQPETGQTKYEAAVAPEGGQFETPDDLAGKKTLANKQASAQAVAILRKNGMSDEAIGAAFPQLADKLQFMNTQEGIVGLSRNPYSKPSATLTPFHGYPPAGASDNAGSPEDIPYYAESVREGNIEFSGVPQRLRGGVLRYMQNSGMTKGRKVTALEQRQLDDTRKLQPAVARLKQYIESNGMQYANDWGDKAAAFKRFAQYSLGFKPTGDPLGDAAAPTIAAVTVMATAPWTAGRQGKYLFDQIQQHVPQMGDTPAQMYNKLGILQNIIDNNEYMLTVGREGQQGLPPNGRELTPAEINQLPPP